MKKKKKFQDIKPPLKSIKGLAPEFFNDPRFKKGIMVASTLSKIFLWSVLIFVVLNLNFFLKQSIFTLDSWNVFDSVGIDLKTRIEPTEFEPDHIYIKSLGIEAPVHYAQERRESEFQKLLRDGVVHYPETALPGELGNVYIFGHSSDLPFNEGDYKTVFALLTKIQDGDEIVLTDSENNVFKYVVRNSYVASARDDSVLDQYESKSRLLTLQTSYPVGTALKRFIVLSEMIENE